MKRCPHCGQTFSDENSFCLDDGTSLVYLSTNAPFQSFTPFDAPTQVISKPTTTEKQSSSSPWLYALVGVLATVIGAMGFFIWWSRTEPDQTRNIARPVTPPTSSPELSAVNTSTVPPIPTPQIVNSAPAPPAIDVQRIESDVLARLSKWEHDGEAKDGFAVVANYADTVAYYRRARATRDFIQQDKSRAYSNFDSIDITLSDISIAPAADGKSARVVLDKAYVLSGSRTLQGKVQQEIRLVRVGSDWLINGERDIRVYYQTK